MTVMADEKDNGDGSSSRSANSNPDCLAGPVSA